jgi:hypothetical protein
LLHFLPNDLAAIRKARHPIPQETHSKHVTEIE